MVLCRRGGSSSTWCTASCSASRHALQQAGLRGIVRGPLRTFSFGPPRRPHRLGTAQSKPDCSMIFPKYRVSPQPPRHGVYLRGPLAGLGRDHRARSTGRAAGRRHKSGRGRAPRPAGRPAEDGHALPGFGIVAAVLGIVITMQAIDGPPPRSARKSGPPWWAHSWHLVVYGFVGPLAVSWNSWGSGIGLFPHHCHRHRRLGQRPSDGGGHRQGRSEYRPRIARNSKTFSNRSKIRTGRP